MDLTQADSSNKMQIHFLWFFQSIEGYILVQLHFRVHPQKLKLYCLFHYKNVSFIPQPSFTVDNY